MDTNTSGKYTASVFRVDLRFGYMTKLRRNWVTETHVVGKERGMELGRREAWRWEGERHRVGKERGMELGRTEAWSWEEERHGVGKERGMDLGRREAWSPVQSIGLFVKFMF
jgi:hypothetical protein